MINKEQIVVDYSRDSLFDPLGLRRLKDSYMGKDEKSPQDRFAKICSLVGTDLAHAQRLYDYASQHWLSFSSPILSYGATTRGLPISCYLSYIDDSAEALVDTLSEVAWLSMLGGGVGLGVGIRSEDSKSVGVMPHMKVYEAVAMAYRQGETRRGSFASYLDLDHPNIMQFIEMRKPTGDANLRCMELHHGVNVPDRFMEIIERCLKDPNCDDSWELIDPHTKSVKEIVSAKQIWQLLLETRMRTGEPYLHFIDTSNRALPEFQKKLGLKIRQSNICTEITLATDYLRTAVCCLSSPNLEYWDEWKDNYQFYRDIAEMLDNVLDIFIRDAPEEVQRAIHSAMRERAIGVGALGFHALLQKKHVPFESALAVSINKQIFSRYKKHLDRANRELAVERGECPDGVGYGVRFSHTTSIAPNATSSIIMRNTSPSVEPYRGNAYRQDTLSGAFLNKNRFLEKLLNEKGLPGDELESVWQSIVTNAGSVQHLEVLNDYEKAVYKTFAEIDQAWVIQHAADRQPDIDQAQSINLCFKANVAIKKLHDVHFDAWKRGLKTLYYCRSDKIYHGESVNKQVERARMSFENKVEEPTCLACEG